MRTLSASRAQLLRMEAARRQTQHQLEVIDRQITRAMTAFLPRLGRRQNGYRHGKAPVPGAFLERYRAYHAALTAERQPEVDAPLRELARQDAIILGMRTTEGLSPVRRDVRQAILGVAQ